MAVSLGQPLWYEAQNDELSLKQRVLKDCEGKDEILAGVTAVEALFQRTAVLVFGGTKCDLDELCTLYGPTESMVVQVLQRLAHDQISLNAPAKCLAWKLALELEGGRIAMFVAIWCRPNHDGGALIFPLSEDSPEPDFPSIGATGRQFRDKPMPVRGGLLGLVSMAVRYGLLACANGKLQPMTYGSGSNLKMLEYCAVKPPVAARASEALGFALAESEYALICTREEFSTAGNASGADAAMDRIVNDAHDLVRSRRSLDSGAQQLSETINTGDQFRWRRPGRQAEAAE